MDWLVFAASGGFLGRLKSVFLGLYQLVLGLGGPGLLVLALLDSSFLSIPEGNDFLIIVLSMGGSWSNMVYYATMTTLGSVIGCSLLYRVGTRGGGYVQKRLHRPGMRRVQSLYKRRGVLAIIIPSLLPAPHALQGVRPFGRGLRTRLSAVSPGGGLRQKSPLFHLGRPGRCVRRTGRGFPSATLSLGRASGADPHCSSSTLVSGLETSPQGRGGS